MMKPLQQYEDSQPPNQYDHATGKAFSHHALERMLVSCRYQPNWRVMSAAAAAYYDGQQLTPEQIEHCNREGLEPRAINLIRPIINSVLGQEAKSRTDIRIEADDDEHAEVAEVISAKMQEAERETNAHAAVSNAYASGVKKGLGWVHVSRNSDPLDYPYRVESVPIEEVWWDWNGQRDYGINTGCRWIVRKRFIDLDELQAAMPEFAELLQYTVQDWASYAYRTTTAGTLGEPDYVLDSRYRAEQVFSETIGRREWVDSLRRMIAMYEVWYRVPASCVVMHLSPTRRVEFDPQNMIHQQLVASGRAKVTKGMTSQVRRSLYAGPHRLYDEGTKRRTFPYIPFFAFRRDIDKSPYGLIEGMIVPQDEYNERRLRMQWMLKSRQVELDSDALDPKYNKLSELADEVMRPDLVLVTDPNRRNVGQPAVKVTNTLQLQPEQFTVMKDSMELIQHTAGRFNSQLGSAQVQSGIANSILVEQGEQSMGEMNDNYLSMRKAVFESLADEISSDHLAENLPVKIGSGKSRRVVVLNTFTPEGEPLNRVEEASISTGMSEVPSTPAYRQQQQQQLGTVIQALGSNAQAVAILAPSYIETTSLPNRQEVADALRKMAGLPTPGDKQGQEQADAMQQQMLQQQQQQQQQAMAAKTDVDVSAAERNRAAAQLAANQAQLVAQRVRAGFGAAETDKLLADARGEQQSEDDIIQQALQEAEA